MASNFQIPLFNGTWDVGLTSDITSRGYDIPPTQLITYSGGNASVQFVVYSSGQTPARLTQYLVQGGQFQCLVTGSSARTYRVEASSNPSNPNSWVPITTNSPSQGSFYFWDNAQNGARFYRTKVLH